MSKDFVRTFTNARSLKAATNSMSIEELTASMLRLESVIKEREEQEQAQLAKMRAREEKLNHVLDLLKKDGVEPSELIDHIQNSPKPSREPRPAKYKYVSDGVEKTWTGQGRTPSVIQQKIESGECVLEDFLI